MVTGVERRRRFTVEQKMRLVEECNRPGMTVSYVARTNGIAPSQLLSVNVRDHRGQATDAEVGISVAQETALRSSPSDSQTDPLETFGRLVFLRGGAASWYSLGKDVLFETAFPPSILHLEAPRTGGIDPGPLFQTMGPDVIDVSHLTHAIASTVFWDASLQTDPGGSITATFRDPISEAYSANAIAVGSNGEVGYATRVIAEKPKP